MDADEFKHRTKRFAMDVIRLIGELPGGKVSDVLGRQLLRSATSVGANYRAAARAQSPAQMLAKLSIVEEEADECLYWLELLAESGVVPIERARPLKREASELLAMTVASKKTLRARVAAPARRQSTIGNRQSGPPGIPAP
ncbi:MAG: four helix bundle protein [Dehalococcoidia bacterium]|nr:four helix bundle protein [Dehalococcoidia bacterium]